MFLCFIRIEYSKFLIIWVNEGEKAHDKTQIIEDILLRAFTRHHKLLHIFLCN